MYLWSTGFIILPVSRGLVPLKFTTVFGLFWLSNCKKVGGETCEICQKQILKTAGKMIQKLPTRQWITIWGDIHQFKFADEVWIESAYI